MALLDFTGTGGYRSFDFDQCSGAGGRLAADYRDAAPIPHVILDEGLIPDPCHAGADLHGIERTTDFRPRPGTRDKRDWQIMLRHLKADWMPPILQRRKV